MPLRVRAAALACLLAAACARSGGPAAPRYDVIIRGGTVYDGSGAPPRLADVGIRGDTIATIGDLATAAAARELHARGLAVAPGFINMLSWANVALLHDGRSQGDIRQGVTLEVFGEGTSMGPVNDSMRARSLRNQGDHPLRHPLDHPRRIPRAPGAARRLAQRGLVHRRDHGADP